MATLPLPSRTIEWSPVIAGSILACAVSLVLMQFGHALGLSFTNLRSIAVITPQSVMVFGLWALWVQISASITGGYLAGRMLSPWDGSHESELRDGAHGLLVWALSTLLTALAIGAATFAASFAAAHGAGPESTISAVMAKKITIISGFSLAAISLVSGAIAWIMATIGGDHRDQKVGVSHHVTFRRAAPRARRA